MVDFPKDMKPEAIKAGNRWIAVYSVPWKHNSVVKDGNKISRFDTELEAFVAASAMLCHQFRNKTRGWGEGISATNEMEAVFGKKKTSARRRR